MTRAQFLARLKNGLGGLPETEIADILADYESHFRDAAAQGRSEDDVCASLGDPVRLSKELRAEASLRRWETNRNPKNFFSAGLALFGLVTLDFFILLPFLFVSIFVAGVLIFVLGILGTVGAGLVMAIFYSGGFGGLAVAIVGLVILSAVVGTGAIILLLLAGAMHLLGRYVRLHYRLLNKPQD
jgi:uncharacterized membrane protein